MNLPILKILHSLVLPVAKLLCSANLLHTGETYLGNASLVQNCFELSVHLVPVKLTNSPPPLTSLGHNIHL